MILFNALGLSESDGPPTKIKILHLKISIREGVVFMLTSISYSKNLMDDEIDQAFLSPRLSNYCESYNFQFANTRLLLGGLVSLPDCFYKGKKSLITVDSNELEALLIWESEFTSQNKTGRLSVYVLMDDASLVMSRESDGVQSFERFSLHRIMNESDRMCVNGVFYLHDLYDAIFEKRFIYPFRINEDFPIKSPKFY